MRVIGLIVLLLVGCSDETKAPSEDKIRQYLMENPEIVIKIINNAVKYERTKKEKRATISLEERRGVLTQSGLGSVVRGTGDITLIEFFDYQCGYCKSTHPALHAALKKDRRVRVIYKEFPILGETSTIAARAAIAAQKQGQSAYLKLHAALMTTPGRLTEAKLFEIAKAVGLNIPKLRAAMKSPEINDAITANLLLAQDLKITGTPSFILLNDNHIELIKGARKTNEFIELFSQLRAK